MTIKPGFSRTKPYRFDAEAITAFARMSGDDNFLHHDANVARASRFGGLIASGAHMSGVLMGFGASMLSSEFEAVGLEFWFRFVKAIPAGTRTTLQWTVTAVAPNAKLGGQLVMLEGSIAGADGTVHVTATGKAVVWDKLVVSE